MLVIITHGSVGATYDFALSKRAILILWRWRGRVILFKESGSQFSVYTRS